MEAREAPSTSGMSPPNRYPMKGVISTFPSAPEADWGINTPATASAAIDLHFPDMRAPYLGEIVRLIHFAPCTVCGVTFFPHGDSELAGALPLHVPSSLCCVVVGGRTVAVHKLASSLN